MHPKRLSIVGVGLLGGSLGLAWKKIARDCRIVGYGHNPQTLGRAMEMGAIDEATGDLAGAVGGADLVVLCTPVGLFGQILEQIGPVLKAGAIVTDVGSTKRSVVAEAGRRLPKSVHFVGSHPMAGSEKRGVQFARADLFQQALCILTPTAGTDPVALESVDGFWKKLGMRTTRLSPDEHDSLVGQISHLPHAVAAALIAIQEEGGLELAGKGFFDTTRVASGDGGLWRDILLDNADNVREGIDRLQQVLGELSRKLENRDVEGIKAWLNGAAGVRERWLSQRNSE